MENQTMQDAPHINDAPSFSTDQLKAVVHHSNQQATQAHQPAELTTDQLPTGDHPSDITAPIQKAATSAPVAEAATTTQPTQLSRDQILDTTWQCLREKGYDATTIRQIANRLGCAIGSIYRYYRDKHDLLSCVTQRPFEAVADAVDADESFPATARMYVKLAEGETQSYMLMFWLANQKLNGKSQAQSTFELPDVINRIIQGWTKQSGTQQTAMTRWSLLHGAVTAGADALAMLSAIGLATAASMQDDQEEPHDRTAQQIVTVMRTPPLPRHLRDAASEAKSRTTGQTSQTNQPSKIARPEKYEQLSDAMASTQEQHTVSTGYMQRQKEDVCLL